MIKEVECRHCGTLFTKNSGYHFYCKPTCRYKHGYVTYKPKRKYRTTSQQYSSINGNWRRFFNRQVTRGGKMPGLTPDDLIALLKRQDGKCALTGVEMTCLLKKGERGWTNASIDRINAGQPYEPSNVQLVCAAVNIFRSSMPLDEYKNWCRLVTEKDQLLLPATVLAA